MTIGRTLFRIWLGLTLLHCVALAGTHRPDLAARDLVAALAGPAADGGSAALGESLTRLGDYLDAALRTPLAVLVLGGGIYWTAQEMRARRRRVRTNDDNGKGPS